MADKRLNKIKIDEDGQWMNSLEKVMDDIIFFYENVENDEREFFDSIIYNNLKNDIKTIKTLMEEYMNDIFEIIKYYPFLISTENYELISKCEQVIQHLIIEKTLQAQYVGLDEDNLEFFKDQLLQQKKIIIEDLTTNE